MTLAELRDEIRGLIQAGSFSYSALSADAKTAFVALFTTERGKRFTQDRIDVLRQFWIRTPAPSHPAVIAANQSLPGHIQITPVQAVGGQHYVNVDILTDEETWGQLFPYLRGQVIDRLDSLVAFPSSGL